jgi:hypothetical protein
MVAAEASIPPEPATISADPSLKVRLEYCTVDKRTYFAEYASRSADCPPFCPD